MLKNKRISVLKSLLIATISAGIMFSIPAAFAAGNNEQDAGAVEAAENAELTLLGNAAEYAAYSGSVSMGVNALDGQEMPELDRNKQSELEITVSTDGEAPEVARIDAYINDEFKCSLTEQPYALDISSVGNGTHILELLAFDAEGNQVSKYTHKFALVSMEKNLIYESDFSDGAGSMSIDGVTQQGGYYEFAEIDSEHGKSFMISSEKKSTDLGPYTHVLTSPATATFETEMDVCILEGNVAFHLSYRNSINGSRIGVLRFANNGKIELLGVGGTLEQNRIETYEKGKWYNIRMTFYAATRTYDLYINDELQITGRSAHGYANTQGVSLLRFIMENYEDSKGSIAIDNVKMHLLSRSIYITGTASDINGNTVAPNADKLYVFLNNNISTEGFESYVKLSNRTGNLPINNITYDSAAMVMMIEPCVKMQSSVDYVVTLEKGLPLTGDKQLGEDIYGRFTVAPDDLDVTDVSFNVNNGKVTVTAQYENLLDNDMEAKAIVNVWKNGILERVSVFDFTFYFGVGNVSVGQYTLSKGESLEIHFIESFDRHSLITSNTYEYVMK